MAMHSSRLRQDQNFSVHNDGVSSVQKKKGSDGVKGRKALNDISNSKIQGKSQSQSQRKPLSDLTNSCVNVKNLTNTIVNVKPFDENKKKKGKLKKLEIVVKEEDIAEEGFLHNHEECIKAQKTAMDLEFNSFLQTRGLLQGDFSESPRKSKDEDDMMMVLEEIPEEIIIEKEKEKEKDFSDSPIFGSPDSSSSWWPFNEYDPQNFTLLASP